MVGSWRYHRGPTFSGPGKDLHRSAGAHGGGVAVTEMAGAVGNSHSAFFIDDVAAPMALVEGVNGSDSQDQVTMAIHLACFALWAVPHFDYIESETDWSDRTSGKGCERAWAELNHVQVETCGVAGVLLLCHAPQ